MIIIRRASFRQLGLHGDEAPANLSGGEARRAALARVLAPSPDSLPARRATNHLGSHHHRMAGSELDSRRGALVIISHDRRFLSTCRRTAWLDRGQIRQIDRVLAPSRLGATRCWPRKSATSTSRSQDRHGRSIGCATGVSGRRKRNVKRLGNLFALREARRDYRGAAGDANLAAAEATSPAS